MTGHPSDRLTGRVALITGGASGIGAATARRLADEGAMTVVADMDGSGAAGVAAEIAAAGGQATSACCDQTDAEQVDRLFAHVADAHSRLDICVANAGWGRYGAFLDVSLRTWQRTFDVNVTGTFLVCQAAARRMAELGGGSIVVTSSSGAIEPVALFSAYCAAKAALNMMVRVMAYELGPHDIRVNAVMPGVTETGMTGALLETGVRDVVEAESPLGRLARPDDIAGTIAFLAGDDSAYVNGAALMVDGGGSAYWPGWFETDFRQRSAAQWALRDGRK